MLISEKYDLDITGKHAELSSCPTQINYPQEKQFSAKERLIVESDIKSLKRVYCA